MEKYFVSLEIAKQLKALGFNKDCLAMYSYDEFDPNKELKLSYDDGIVNGIIGLNTGDFILASLYQQALDFLREKYEYHIYVKIFFNKTFDYVVTSPKFTKRTNHLDGPFKTNNEALEAVILKILSEIV